VLAKLELRFPKDEGVRAAIADLDERFGEHARAEKLRT
jgi:hypothetical protein